MYEADGDPSETPRAASPKGHSRILMKLPLICTNRFIGRRGKRAEDSPRAVAVLHASSPVLSAVRSKSFVTVSSSLHCAGQCIRTMQRRDDQSCSAKGCGAFAISTSLGNAKPSGSWSPSMSMKDRITPARCGAWE